MAARCNATKSNAPRDGRDTERSRDQNFERSDPARDLRSREGRRRYLEACTERNPGDAGLIGVQRKRQSETAVKGDGFQAPEHLDRALHVTTPKAWLALFILIIIRGTVALWLIIGKVSTYVQAEGIVFSRGGMIVDAVSSAGGTLSRILPSVVDTVSEGELVADIFDAETLARHVSAVALADEPAQFLKDRESELDEENTLAAENIAKQRARLDELERPDRERVEKLHERLRTGEDMLARGISNRATVERSEQVLDLARRNLFDTLRWRDEIEASHLRRVNDLKARVDEPSAKAEYVAARNRVNELASLIETWRIRAPVTERVTEIKAQRRATLGPGESVLAIETGLETARSIPASIASCSPEVRARGQQRCRSRQWTGVDVRRKHRHRRSRRWACRRPKT